MTQCSPHKKIKLQSHCGTQPRKRNFFQEMLACKLDRRQSDCESESISVQRWALCMTKKPCEASKPNATGSKSAIVCVRSIINPSLETSLALQAGISPLGSSSRTSGSTKSVFVTKSTHSRLAKRTLKRRNHRAD